MPEIIPVILCGGSGSRLWPASRESYPKQFLRLMDDSSLLQNTARRALGIAGTSAGNLVTVTLGALAGEVISQLSSISPGAGHHVLCEPVMRNTAAAVAFAASYVEQEFGRDSLMWVLPSDHHIGDENALARAFCEALEAAGRNYLVTFGIQPRRPETGYGYIRLGNNFSWGSARKADAFVEKPDARTALSYIRDGNYLWNSGMFLFSAGALLDEYGTYAPLILQAVKAAVAGAGHPRAAAEHLYKNIPDQPFDKAIMEKSCRVAVVPCDPIWSDIGSWQSLWEIWPKDVHGNAIQGRAACHNTRNCLIQAKTRLVACAGLENIVVVETPDALLIASRDDSDAMRALVKTLKDAGCPETVDLSVIKLPDKPLFHSDDTQDRREVA